MAQTAAVALLLLLSLRAGQARGCHRCLLRPSVTTARRPWTCRRKRRRPLKPAIGQAFSLSTLRRAIPQGRGVLPLRGLP
jgi:hypothetical protein